MTQLLDLYKEAKISQAITPTAGAAGTSDIDGAALDMSGFESVTTIITLGAITANAVTSIKMQQSDSSGSGYSDLTGTSITVADDDDEEIKVIALVKPEKRYVRVQVARSTQNAVVASAEYIQLGAMKAPTTQPTGVEGESHVSPVEGTA